MRTDDFANKKRAELAETLRLMLAGEVNLIDGCRRVVSLASIVGLHDDQAVIPFRGFESETDYFPRGDVRANYAREYLAELDDKAVRYLDDARTEILRSCGDLLTRLGN